MNQDDQDVAHASLASDNLLSEGMDCVVFKVGDTEYGIDLLHILQIRSYQQPRKLKGMPMDFLGCIDLQEVSIPVIDLRIKFRQQKVCYDQSTVVLLVCVEQSVMALVVDALSGVEVVCPSQLCSVTALASEAIAPCLQARVWVQDRLVSLLNPEKLLSTVAFSTTSLQLH